MDTDRDGQVSLAEFGAFDWPNFIRHVLDSRRVAMRMQAAEFSKAVARGERRAFDNPDAFENGEYTLYVTKKLLPPKSIDYDMLHREITNLTSDRLKDLPADDQCLWPVTLEGQGSRREMYVTIIWNDDTTRFHGDVNSAGEFIFQVVPLQPLYPRVSFGEDVSLIVGFGTNLADHVFAGRLYKNH